MNFNIIQLNQKCLFLLDKCLENYKNQEMYEVVNDDESLRSKFKSEFVQAVNLGKIEPEINTEQLSNTDEQDLIYVYFYTKYD